jgi:hypothetical protein
VTDARKYGVVKYSRKELDEVRASHIEEYPSTTLAAETLVLGDNQSGPLTPTNITVSSEKGDAGCQIMSDHEHHVPESSTDP